MNLPKQICIAFVFCLPTAFAAQDKCADSETKDAIALGGSIDVERPAPSEGENKIAEFLGLRILAYEDLGVPGGSDGGPTISGILVRTPPVFDSSKPVDYLTRGYNPLGRPPPGYPGYRPRCPPLYRPPFAPYSGYGAYLFSCYAESAGGWLYFWRDYNPVYAQNQAMFYCSSLAFGCRPLGCW